MMSNDLYFVQPIARALPNPRAADVLRTAFGDIVRRGQQPRFERGYRQFLRWMTAVAVARGELDTGVPRGELVRQPPPSEVVRLFIERDDLRVADVELTGVGERRSVDGIQPGRYRIIFETGWVLLDATLSPADLLWTAAHPGVPLSMVADDGHVSPFQPTREFDLASGSVAARVYPGPEGGRIVFVINPVGGPNG